MFCAKCEIEFQTAAELYHHIITNVLCVTFYTSAEFHNILNYDAIINSSVCNVCEAVVTATEPHICAGANPTELLIQTYGTLPIYQCGICSRVFFISSEYNAHSNGCLTMILQLNDYIERFHKNVNIFRSAECPRCIGLKFYTEEELNAHCEACMLICRFCKLTYPNIETLQNHRQYAAVCVQCNLTFCNQYVLNNHLTNSLTCMRCHGHYSNNELNAHLQLYFMCYSCDAGFCTENQLNAHVPSCTICRFCRFQYATTDEVIAHRKNPTQCTMCQNNFCNPTILERHRVPCPKCNLIFCFESGMQAHSINCFACQCGRNFNDINELSAHQANMANCTVTCEHCNLNFDSIDAMNAHTRTYVTCQKCNSTFCDVNVLNAHMATCSVCPYCKVHFPAIDSFVAHKQTVCDSCGLKCCNLIELNDHNSNYVKCDKCGAMYCQQHLLVAHENRCVSHKIYICPHCKLSFSDPDRFENHTVDCRYVPTPKYTNFYKCCGINFWNQFYYLRHTKNVHDTIQITCSICSESVDAHTYEAHVFEEHETVSPYLCPICSEAFKSMDEYKLHYTAIHHTPPPNSNKPLVLGFVLDKYYTCGTCRRMYTERSSFIHHMRTIHHYTNLPCYYCYETIPLHLCCNHMSTHENELCGFQCSICMKYYTSKYTAEGHLCIPPIAT